MRKFAIAAACFALAGTANAGTISASEFDVASFNTATKNGASFLVEGFETIGATMGVGQLAGPLVTDVGIFSALSGTGTGSTCDASGGDCTNLFLNNTTINGQGNMLPGNGVWSLNANDTFGIQWDVVMGAGGFFNRVVFAIMDAADRGANVTIATSSDSVVFQNMVNANQQLIVINFAKMVDKARVTIASSKLDDSFSIDGASVGVVPLPAGGLLLLTGLGAFILRRRKTATVA